MLYFTVVLSLIRITTRGRAARAGSAEEISLPGRHIFRKVSTPWWPGFTPPPFLAAVGVGIRRGVSQYPLSPEAENADCGVLNIVFYIKKSARYRCICNIYNAPIRKIYRL